MQDIARYPEGSGYLLTERLARKHRLAADCITLGNGSNDVLDLLARVFLTADHTAIYSQYAFAVYPIVIQATGARAHVAAAHDGSRGPAYGHDLVAMNKLIAANTRLVFIANPNNPTGTWLNGEELQAFVEGVPGHVMVVVDEAYFEYVDKQQYPDTSKWLERYPNLVVTRTFSKAYGLAGLRVGYCLSHPDVADLLNRVRQPFNVNQPAQAAALAALDDQAHVEEAVRQNCQGMLQLTNGFDRLGISYIESAGNFIAFETAQAGMDVYNDLLQEGMIVRPVANYGMPHHLRVTVGLEDENRRFLRALEKVLS